MRAASRRTPATPTSSASPAHPGVGKSTTTSALITHYRGDGLKVSSSACDPTSPFSGGAISR
jgi:putative protein kinase ArgK-like GTPase of G3E family